MGHRFYVSVGNNLVAEFRECTGLEVQTEVFEYQEGGVNSFVHKLPGRTKYTNIVLKRGMCQADELWKWYTQRLAGTYPPRDQRMSVSIILYDEPRSQELKRWNLLEAYPVRWSAPDFRAEAGEIALESLEIAHHGFDMTG
jgi:phage tail-like protein